MTQELNWCGWPIGPGESYYGKAEHISETLDKNPARAAAKQHKHYEIITERAVCEVFGNVAYKLTRTEAAKRLGLLSGVHRTTAYRNLSLNGRFARHLHSDGALLSWR